MDYTWDDLYNFAIKKGIVANTDVISIGDFLFFKDGEIAYQNYGLDPKDRESIVLNFRTSIARNRTPAQMKLIIEGLL